MYPACFAAVSGSIWRARLIRKNPDLELVDSAPRKGVCVVSCVCVCSSYQPAGSQPYSIIYAVANPVLLNQGKIRAHLDLLSIPRLWGEKYQNV